MILIWRHNEVSFQLDAIDTDLGREGHIVHCLDGEFFSEMEDGGAFTLKKGMTYVVSDELSLHRLVSGLGAKLLIIDGDFLRR